MVLTTYVCVRVTLLMKGFFMNRKAFRFTLMELLTVVAIIGILAAIVIPTVATAQQRGRITQAKSDISTLKSAFAQLNSDYNKIIAKKGSNYYFGGKTVSIDDDVATVKDDAYDAMIAELCVPKNSALGTDNSVKINKRKKVYFDPQKGFNPDENYNTTANKETLWRDPWGNPYMVYIKVTMDDEIELPGTNDKKIASNLAIYSFGPNGVDDKGCNVDLDTCILSDTSKHKEHDDVSSWNL